MTITPVQAGGAQRLEAAARATKPVAPTGTGRGTLPPNPWITAALAEARRDAGIATAGSSESAAASVLADPHTLVMHMRAQREAAAEFERALTTARTAGAPDSPWSTESTDAALLPAGWTIERLPPSAGSVDETGQPVGDDRWQRVFDAGQFIRSYVAQGEAGEDFARLFGIDATAIMQAHQSPATQGDPQVDGVPDHRTVLLFGADGGTGHWAWVDDAAGARITRVEVTGTEPTSTGTSGRIVTPRAGNPFRIELHAVDAGHTKPEFAERVLASTAEIGQIDLLLADPVYQALIPLLPPAPIVVESDLSFALVERYGANRLMHMQLYEQAATWVREHFEVAIANARSRPPDILLPEFQGTDAATGVAPTLARTAPPGWRIVRVEQPIRHDDYGIETAAEAVLEWQFDAPAYARWFGEQPGLLSAAFAAIYGVGREVEWPADGSKRLLLADDLWILDPAVGRLQHADNLQAVRPESIRLHDGDAVWFEPGLGLVTNSGNLHEGSDWFDITFGVAQAAVIAYASAVTGGAAAAWYTGTATGAAATTTLSGAVVAGAMGGAVSSAFSGITQNGLVLRDILRAALAGGLTAGIARLDIGDGTRLSTLGLSSATGATADPGNPWARASALLSQAGLSAMVSAGLGGRFGDSFRASLANLVAGEFSRTISQTIQTQELHGAEASALRTLARVAHAATRIAASAGNPAQAMAQDWLAGWLGSIPAAPAQAMAISATHHHGALARLAEQVSFIDQYGAAINDIDYFNDTQRTIFEQVIREGNAPEAARRYVLLIEEILSDPHTARTFNSGGGSTGPAVPLHKPAGLDDRASRSYDETISRMISMGASSQTAAAAAFEASLLSDIARSVERIDTLERDNPLARVTPELAAERQKMICALVSKDVYFDRSIHSILPASVYRLEQEELVSLGLGTLPLSDRRSGFFSAVYRDRLTEQIIIANRGTELSIADRMPADMLTNVIQAVGLQTEQYRLAIHVARNLREDVANDRLIFTGHSLGGGLASAQAAVGRGIAITWNASGLHPATLTREGLDSFRTLADRVFAYFVRGEFVNATQDRTAPWMVAGQAIASASLPGRLALTLAEALRIGPPAAGQRIPLEPAVAAHWHFDGSVSRLGGADEAMDQTRVASNPVASFEQHGIAQVIYALRRAFLPQLNRAEIHRYWGP